MTLDARRLARALARHGRVARVVVAGARGSAPREAGAEMLVWADGQEGTIGGGALEWEAARAARALLARASGLEAAAEGGPGGCAASGAADASGSAGPPQGRAPHGEGPRTPGAADGGAASEAAPVGQGGSPAQVRDPRWSAPAPDATPAPDAAPPPRGGPSEPAGAAARLGEAPGEAANDRADGRGRGRGSREDGRPSDEGHHPADPRARARGTGSSDDGPPSGPPADPRARGRGAPLPAPRLTRHPLGPALGQCCGGAVSLVTEVLVAVPQGSRRALRVEGRAPEPPAGCAPERTRIERGWLVEPVTRAREPLWIWGAGHVGRALVATLAPLDRFDIAWIDVAIDRFPEGPMAEAVVAPDPPLLAARAPREARHLIVTHSHAIDLALCHALLGRGFLACGLIGSATKWARFRARLGALGHAADAIRAIECPIGDPAFGKHPQAIAIGVAAALLREGAVPRAAARGTRPARLAPIPRDAERACEAGASPSPAAASEGATPHGAGSGDRTASAARDEGAGPNVAAPGDDTPPGAPAPRERAASGATLPGHPPGEDAPSDAPDPGARAAPRIPPPGEGAAAPSQPPGKDAPLDAADPRARPAPRIPASGEGAAPASRASRERARA